MGNPYRPECCSMKLLASAGLVELGVEIQSANSIRYPYGANIGIPTTATYLDAFILDVHWPCWWTPTLYSPLAFQPCSVKLQGSMEAPSWLSLPTRVGVILSRGAVAGKVRWRRSKAGSRRFARGRNLSGFSLGVS